MIQVEIWCVGEFGDLSTSGTHEISGDGSESNRSLLMSM